VTDFFFIVVLRRPGIKTKLDNLLIQLRKNCAHPDLLNAAYDSNSVSKCSLDICYLLLYIKVFFYSYLYCYLFLLFAGLYPAVDKLLEQCGKFQLLDRLLDALLKRKQKVDVLFLFHSLNMYSCMFQHMFYDFYFVNLKYS
jgi:ATP-dependent DNA helicase